MTQYLKLIKILVNTLNNQGILKSIDKPDFFYDELKIFHYRTSLTNQKKGSQASSINQTGGSGISSTSKHLALLKSLVEAIERESLNHYKKESFIFYKYQDIKNEAIDISLFTKASSAQNKKIAWVKGLHLNNTRLVFIPAQLIYIRYYNKKEPHLSKLISGSAAGFDKTTTLLRAIYEVVERDALMTIYLNKISPKRIDLDSIHNLLTNKIVKNCRRYNLEPYLFEMTNDLEIPTFLSFFVDLTGIGESFSAGAKSSLNIKKAINGSLEESHLTRSLTRTEIALNKNMRINPKKIETLSERARFWYDRHMLSKINWLFQQPAEKYKIPSFNITPEAELKLVKEKLEKKGFQIYYVDITPSFFKKLNGYVFKAIIPGLQDIYFNEENKNINITRLKQVAQYFGKKRFIINNIPHFFL